MFQLNWNDVNNKSVSIFSDKDCAVIVAIYDQKNRRDSLIAVLQVEEWEVKKEIEIIVGHENQHGRTKRVLSKSLKVGNELSFKVPENHMPITIFVVEGKVILFSIETICEFDITFKILDLVF